MDDPLLLDAADTSRALHAIIQRIAHVPAVPIQTNVLELLLRYTTDEKENVSALTSDKMATLVGGLMKVGETQNSRDGYLALSALRNLITCCTNQSSF